MGADFSIEMIPLLPINISFGKTGVISIILFEMLLAWFASILEDSAKNDLCKDFAKPEFKGMIRRAEVFLNNESKGN